MMSKNEEVKTESTIQKHNRSTTTDSIRPRQVFLSGRRTLTRGIVIAILIPLGIIILLVGVAMVVGGGVGTKRIGLSGALHTGEPVIMAHRGVWQEHPENSYAAFEAARKAGFKGVEIDVKRSADGRFYLFHDRESTELLGVDIDLGNQRLEDLQRYALYHNGRPTNQRILSLEDFALEFADDFVVFLDIKRHGNNDLQGLTTEIATFIERHHLQKRVIVGGDFLFTAWFEYRFPELYTSLSGPGDLRARAYLWIPTRFRSDFIIARLNEITPGLIDWLRERALIHRWIVYGVNASNREQVLKWGFSKLLVD